MRSKGYIENGVHIKRPQNYAEARCFDFMEKNGWTCTKKGYPDFFCFRGNEICFVEVKPKSTYKLRAEQKKIMKVLSDNGFKCYKYTLDKGLQAFNENS